MNFDLATIEFAALTASFALYVPTHIRADRKIRQLKLDLGSSRGLNAPLGADNTRLCAENLQLRAHLAETATALTELHDDLAKADHTRLRFADGPNTSLNPTPVPLIAGVDPTVAPTPHPAQRSDETSETEGDDFPELVPVAGNLNSGEVSPS